MQCYGWYIYIAIISPSTPVLLLFSGCQHHFVKKINYLLKDITGTKMYLNISH